MDKCIIYQTDGDAPAAIIYPCKCELTVKEIADKDVPEGVGYWIVSRADVDALYSEYGGVRDAWRVSEESVGRPPDGAGFGQAKNEAIWAEREAARIAELDALRESALAAEHEEESRREKEALELGFGSPLESFDVGDASDGVGEK